MAKSGGGSSHDYSFKLLVIGDDNVGKTSLLLRFIRNEFRVNKPSTMLVEFASKQLIIDGKKIDIQFWERGRQDPYKPAFSQLYRGTEGILIVLDLSKSTSFDRMTSCLEEVHKHTPPDLPMILLGNKCDLVDQRQVSHDQATALAEHLNIPYMETSALNASNIEEAFTALVTNIYKKKTFKSKEDGSVLTDDVLSKLRANFDSTHAKKGGPCKPS